MWTAICWIGKYGAWSRGGYATEQEAMTAAWEHGQKLGRDDTHAEAVQR